MFDADSIISDTHRHLSGVSVDLHKLRAGSLLWLDYEFSFIINWIA